MRFIASTGGGGSITSGRGWAPTGDAWMNETLEPEVSAELGLLSRGGQSTVNYGNLLTLPVAGGLLFVEPVYSERANQESSYPQLARVLVFYNDQVGFGPSLSEALDEVFGPGAGAGATPTPGGGGSPPAAGAPGGASPALAAATAELQAALGQVRSAQQSGDLGSLGQALTALDTAVKNFQTANGQAPAPASAPAPVPGPGG